MRGLLAAVLVFGFAWAADGETAAGRVDPGPLAELLILFGCLFIVAGTVGMLRFPDFYTRLHASTKLVTLGGIGLFGGAALAFAGLGTGRIVLIAIFFTLTAPLSGYMIARSGYLRGLAPYREEGSVDDWEALGTAVASLARTQRDAGSDPPTTP